MKIIYVFIIACLSFSAYAQTSSDVAFDRKTRAIINAGSVDKGRAKVAKGGCVSCHGINGKGVAANPSVAGHFATYTFKQLKDFKDGKRKATIMGSFVQALTDADMADIAAWYASLPVMEASFNEAGNAAQLVRIGDGTRMIQSCDSCHGAGGKGMQNDYPALAGQTKESFIIAMKEFRDGIRTNDIYSRMRIVAKQLTDEEIKYLADYYSKPATK